MSTALADAMEALQEKINGQEIDGSIKFEVEGMASIVIFEGVVRLSDEETDCTLSGDITTFEGIFNGDLSATTAFMSGKLKVEGSMGIAMQYNAILS